MVQKLSPKDLRIMRNNTFDKNDPPKPLVFLAQNFEGVGNSAPYVTHFRSLKLQLFDDKTPENPLS